MKFLLTLFFVAVASAAVVVKPTTKPTVISRIPTRDELYSAAKSFLDFRKSHVQPKQFNSEYWRWREILENLDYFTFLYADNFRIRNHYYPRMVTMIQDSGMDQSDVDKLLNTWRRLDIALRKYRTPTLDNLRTAIQSLLDEHNIPMSDRPSNRF